MITEALTQPPPPELYKEAKRFLTQDDSVADYVSGTFVGDVAKNVPAMTQGIPPGADLSGREPRRAQRRPAPAAAGRLCACDGQAYCTDTCSAPAVPAA
jgi:hypothetical protein